MLQLPVQAARQGPEKRRMLRAVVIIVSRFTGSLVDRACPIRFVSKLSATPPLQAAVAGAAAAARQ